MDTKKAEMIKDLLKNVDFTPDNVALIQDNKIVFTHRDKVYRCRMPNQKELVNAQGEQNKEKVRLLNEDNTLTKKQLIKLLKEKQGIDIREIEKEERQLIDELKEHYLSWAIISSDDEETLKEFEQKNNEIQSRLMDVTIERVELLSPCIEEQAKTHYYKYLTYLCSEKQVGIPRKKEDTEKFEKLWETFDDFLTDETSLAYKAIENLQKLLSEVR